MNLHLNEVTADKAQQYTLTVDLYRKLTGKEPTPDELAEVRVTLGLPPEESTERGVERLRGAGFRLGAD